MKALFLSLVAVLAVGCSQPAASTETTNTPSEPTQTTTASKVTCSGCGTEVAADMAVKKDGKDYCSACAAAH